jgi:hypothetical protein
MDEFQLEELSMRRALVKMDDAFREGMQRAIDAGMGERANCRLKATCTRNPKFY